MKRLLLLRSTVRLREIIPVFAAILIALASLAFAAEIQKGPAAKFVKEGKLLRPKEYRTWVFIGSPVTPNELNNGKAAFPEFHDVYMDPVSYAEYRKTGKFRNGTIIVKELVSVGAKSAASGKGYFPGDFIGIAASVKDSKRFAREPGHWAYFSFMGEDGSKLAKAKAQPTTACNACHQKNAAEDWVFTQYYPVLRAAKANK
jgi:cytochrome c553